MGVGDGLQNRGPFLTRDLALTAHAFSDLSERRLSAQIGRLGMEGVAQVALDRCAALGGRRSDLIEIIGWHIANEYVGHVRMLSIMLSTGKGTTLGQRARSEPECAIGSKPIPSVEPIRLTASQAQSAAMSASPKSGTCRRIAQDECKEQQ
jgi:hypothetical protein